MIPAAQARDLIRTGDVLRYRLMLTGNTLACGRLDQRRFTIAMKRTDYVSDSDMQTVDAHLAEAILARPPDVDDPVHHPGRRDRRQTRP